MGAGTHVGHEANGRHRGVRGRVEETFDSCKVRRISLNAHWACLAQRFVGAAGVAGLER
jgi:hypothetical protein